MAFAALNASYRLRATRVVSQGRRRLVSPAMGSDVEEFGTELEAEPPRHLAIARLRMAIAVRQQQHEPLRHLGALHIEPHAAVGNVHDQAIARRRADHDDLRLPDAAALEAASLREHHGRSCALGNREPRTRGLRAARWVDRLNDIA